MANEIVEVKTSQEIAKSDERTMYEKLQLMVVNGKKLSQAEAIALAQYAVVENLDPFALECWYIPNVGPTPGIMGIRRKAREALAKECPNENHSFNVIFEDVTDQMKANEPNIHLAYKATLRDTLRSGLYIKQYDEAKKVFENSDEIIAVVGKPPLTEATAVMYQAELNAARDAKYHPTERCKKRAEALVLKKRFGISYPYSDEELDIREAQTVAAQWEDGQLEDGNEQTTPARPYDPETLKTHIEFLAGNNIGKTVTDGQRGLMVALLNKCYAGSGADMKRHEATQYLTGIGESKKLQTEKPAYLLALLDWLNCSKDSGNDYLPDPMAVTEAQSLLTVARKEAGQEELFND